MKRKTREWVRKAESDLTGASQLAGTKPRQNDLICFHCQQAAEKYLKAVLQELGLKIPHTHDLDDLLDLLLPHHATLRPLRRGLRFLTQFAVDYRYPGENATKRQAEAARRWAERARQELRTRLGLKS